MVIRANIEDECFMIDSTDIRLLGTDNKYEQAESLIVRTNSETYFFRNVMYCRGKFEHMDAFFEEILSKYSHSSDKGDH